MAEFDSSIVSSGGCVLSFETGVPELIMEMMLDDDDPVADVLAAEEAPGGSSGPEDDDGTADPEPCTIPVELDAPGPAWIAGDTDEEDAADDVCVTAPD